MFDNVQELYYKIYNIILKTARKVYVLPFKEVLSNPPSSITWENYVINNIVYDHESCLYFGTVKHDNEIIQLQGPSLDALINDLIEGNKEFDY